MSKIKVILWDIDGTILNFDASERAGIRKCFEQFHLGICTDEMLKDYAQINTKYWQKLERGEMEKEEILTGRFAEFFAKYHLATSVVKEFNDAYQASLGDVICFEEGAKELILEYKGKYKQYAASNGTALAQQKKLKKSGLAEVLEGAFISDLIGSEKPMQGFFDAVFAEVGSYKKEEILIVGDSLTSDIRGGKNAGIVTCWYNPKKKSNTSDIVPDYEVQSLYEIRAILASR